MFVILWTRDFVVNLWFAIYFLTIRYVAIPFHKNQEHEQFIYTHKCDSVLTFLFVITNHLILITCSIHRVIMLFPYMLVRFFCFHWRRLDYPNPTNQQFLFVTPPHATSSIVIQSPVVHNCLRPLVLFRHHKFSLVNPFSSYIQLRKFVNFRVS